MRHLRMGFWSGALFWFGLDHLIGAVMGRDARLAQLRERWWPTWAKVAFGLLCLALVAWEAWDVRQERRRRDRTRLHDWSIRVVRFGEHSWAAYADGIPVNMQDGRTLQHKATSKHTAVAGMQADLLRRLADIVEREEEPAAALEITCTAPTLE